MSGPDWDDHWESLGPPTPERKRGRRPAGIAALTGMAVALMGIMLSSIHWRDILQPLLPRSEQTARITPGPGDHDSGQFARCHGPVRVTCVIDGDTIWYEGHKIRVADINAPEVSEPKCDYEQDLGEKATDRLIQLLNEGPFSLETSGSRDTDVYGRQLRVITRGGQSLGGVLVAEGLAERWVGYRRDWCN